jgi:hypothetical protein
MKNREMIIIGSIVVVLALVLTLVDASQPKQVNWEPSYSARDKMPFGLYVLDAESEKLFEGDSVIKYWKTPYELLDAQYDAALKRYKVKGTVLEISNNDNIDIESVNELIYFAEQGNTVMLSMKNFPAQLLDTLRVETGYGNLLKDSVKINIATTPRDYYGVRYGLGTGYFSKLPGKDSVKVLGYQSQGLNDYPNFIEAKFGRGRFLLHTQPAVFTNYYLLKRDYFNYVQMALSYIPRGTVYWRNDYANTNFFEDPDSKLRYIMSQPGLKWAWRLFLWGILLFMLFNGRRKQRIMPIIEPVKNTTVDFAKTIGNLYYQEGDHHTIIEKKIVYFLEHIRTEYRIETAQLNEEFIQKLHLKSGKPAEDVRAAVNLIQQFRHSKASTANDVVAINNAIEKLRL